MYLYSKKEMADTATILKNSFLIAGAVVGFIAIKKIAETFGIIKTKEEAEVETATEESAGTSTQAVSTNPFLAFNPNYSVALVTAYKKKFPTAKWDIPKQEAIERKQYLLLAQDILKSKDLFNDDEDKLYNVFRTIQTQFQLSLLSRVFSTWFKKDLLEYLKSFLNADELAPILKQVQNYPQYLK